MRSPQITVYTLGDMTYAAPQFGTYNFLLLPTLQDHCFSCLVVSQKQVD